MKRAAARFSRVIAWGITAIWATEAIGQSPIPVMVNPTNNVVAVPATFWPSNRLAMLAAMSLDTSINSGSPNGSGAVVHWSQLLGVPASLADGTDDGGGTNFIASVSTDFEVVASALSITNAAGTGQILRASVLVPYLLSATASSLYQPLDSDLATLASLNGGSLTNLNGTEIRSGTVADARIDAAIARLASPALTGSPTAPTASANDNDTSIATTAFVQTEIADLTDDNLWQATNSVLTRLAGIGAGSQGDFIYRDASGWTNIAKGSAGQVLTATSSGLTFSNVVASSSATTGYITSDQTTTSATAVNATGFSFSVGANEDWAFEIFLLANASGAAGVKVSMSGPSGATIGALVRGTAAAPVQITALSTLTGAVMTSATAGIHIFGIMRVSSTAGTAQLGFASADGVVTATIKAPSWFRASKLN